jgi:hypothetical protein
VELDDEGEWKRDSNKQVVPMDVKDEVQHDPGGAYFPWTFPVRSVEQIRVLWKEEPSLILFIGHLSSASTDGSDDTAADEEAVELAAESIREFIAYATETRSKTKLHFFVDAFTQVNKLKGVYSAYC